ncbi:MAG: glycosyltransferase family 2 protein [Phycisphaerae bacterium]|nr:glycosyltransferase family 2 protein [Phycisphaerae bacterium]
MKDSQLPFVSILAPCRNEVEYVERAVNSILQSDYPADRMEILVLDGMSDDGTRNIVARMAEQDERVRMLDNPQEIVPTAMNIGIRASRGDYVVRIDCHTLFSYDYISKCIEVSQRTCADNVGGYCMTCAGAETGVARAIAAATSCPFGVGNSAFRLTGPEKEVDTVPFGTYRKEIFNKVGLYDERLVRNQDIELNSRIRRAGGRIIISPEIKLSYFNRASYRGLWQQSFNNGLWNLYTVYFVGGGLSLRHFVPMLFVSGLLCLIPLALCFHPLAWLLAADVALYACAAAFSAAQCARRRPVNTLLVMVSFAVLHIAYGLGSLWAMITIPFRFRGEAKRLPGKALTDRTA